MSIGIGRNSNIKNQYATQQKERNELGNKPGKSIAELNKLQAMNKSLKQTAAQLFFQKNNPQGYYEKDISVQGIYKQIELHKQTFEICKNNQTNIASELPSPGKSNSVTMA